MVIHKKHRGVQLQVCEAESLQNCGEAGRRLTESDHSAVL